MKFTEEEFNNLKSVVNNITTHIPKDKSNLIWESYKKITGSREATPCTCPSSAGHWRKAFGIVKEYVEGKV